MYSHQFTLPPLLLVTPPLFLSLRSTPSYHPLFSLKENRRPDLLGIATEHDLTSYNKTKHIPSYQGCCTRQPNRKKKGFKNRQKNKRHPTPTVGSSTRNPATQPKGLCRGPTSDPCRDCVCHFSLSEPSWTLLHWFWGLLSCVLHPSGSYNFRRTYFVFFHTFFFLSLFFLLSLLLASIKWANILPQKFLLPWYSVWL